MKYIFFSFLLCVNIGNFIYGDSGYMGHESLHEKLSEFIEKKGDFYPYNQKIRTALQDINPHLLGNMSVTRWHHYRDYDNTEFRHEVEIPNKQFASFITYALNTCAHCGHCHCPHCNKGAASYISTENSWRDPRNIISMKMVYEVNSEENSIKIAQENVFNVDDSTADIVKPFLEFLKEEALKNHYPNAKFKNDNGKSE